MGYNLPVRLGLVADIHANVAALDAVLGALRSAGVDAIVCLGDIVGYHAEPAECIDRVRAAATATIAGNHDIAVVAPGLPSSVNSQALAAIVWTKANLDPERVAWLAGLPRRIDDPAGWTAVHGSFLASDPSSGYVVGLSLRDNLEAVAAGPQRVAFCGHTHLPMCGWLEGQIVHSSPLLRTVRWPPHARAVLINPGSVGQPRDHDPRASAAVVDLERSEVTPLRCEYAIDRTAAAVRRAGLPESLVERLRSGL